MIRLLDILFGLFLHGPKDRVLHRAFWLPTGLLSAAFIFGFGISYILAFLGWKFLGAPPPPLSLGLACASVLVTLSIAGATVTAIREKVGFYFLYAAMLLYRGAVAGAQLIIRLRIIAAPLGWLSIAVGIILIVDRYSTRIEQQHLNDQYSVLQANIRFFVERHPIAEPSRFEADNLRTTYRSLHKSPASGSLRENNCSTLLLNSILSGFSLPVVTDDQQVPNNLQSLDKSLENLLSREDGAESCDGDQQDFAYHKLWLARINLVRSQQGIVLDRVIKAHSLVLDASRILKVKDFASAAAENSLGNIYAHYASNSRNIAAGYSWPDLALPPTPGGSSVISLCPILNQALEHLDRGRLLANRFDAKFAETRYVNNLSDLKRRLLLFLQTDGEVWYRGGADPLAGLRNPFKEEVANLRRHPFDWLRGEKRRLFKQTVGSGIPEGFITFAQLDCMEREIAQQRSPGPDPADNFSGLEAIRTAIMMGFRDRDLFEHPRQMGLCYLVQSSPDRADFLKLVSDFLQIDPSSLSSDCT